MTIHQYEGKSIDVWIDDIEASWASLMESMLSSSEEDSIGKTDDAGWNALDHLAHVSAWERTALFPLLGRPRHEGAGVTVEEFQPDIDALNETIRKRTAGKSRQRVIDDANRWHRQLIDKMRSADAETLWKSVADLVSEAPTPGDPRPIIAVIASATYGHYQGHRRDIERILAS